tara:strand:- start:302 stop:499 length:198 start_codon:yes stop_codon:yes gene_type:complete
MVTLLAIICFLSFAGFQIPVIMAFSNTRKLIILTSSTIKTAKKLRNNRSMLSLSFQKSVVHHHIN